MWIVVVEGLCGNGLATVKVSTLQERKELGSQREFLIDYGRLGFVIAAVGFLTVG